MEGSSANESCSATVGGAREIVADRNGDLPGGGGGEPTSGGNIMTMGMIGSTPASGTSSYLQSPGVPGASGSPFSMGMRYGQRPLLGPRFNSSITLPQDQRQQLLTAFNAHPAVVELRRWLNDAPNIMSTSGHGPILSYTLGSQETISCIHWKGKYHITGTDIVKILRFRFACLGKPIGNVKKFEEGVFSDLRNLKAGEHATLEEPKSEFLEFLYKHNCIRTQKKQKVFYWYEVRHDDLMLEAFERDAKRHNQAANINNFLRNQAAVQQMNFLQPHQMAAGPGATPRLMPRNNGPAMYMQQMSPMMYAGGAMQVAGPPQMYQGEWEQVTSDPAMDFINDLPLEDNLAGYDLMMHEPVPKSPRLSSPHAGGSSPALSSTSIDPSLISALPAKTQRKIRQQVHQVETCNKLSTLSTDMVKAKDRFSPKEEPKDPLLIDPFNFEGDVTFDSLFPDHQFDTAGVIAAKEPDFFLF